MSENWRCPNCESLNPQRYSWCWKCGSERPQAEPQNPDSVINRSGGVDIASQNTSIEGNVIGGSVNIFNVPIGPNLTRLVSRIKNDKRIWILVGVASAILLAIAVFNLMLAQAPSEAINAVKQAIVEHSTRSGDTMTSLEYRITERGEPSATDRANGIQEVWCFYVTYSYKGGGDYWIDSKNIYIASYENGDWVVFPEYLWVQNDPPFGCKRVFGQQ